VTRFWVVQRRKLQNPSPADEVNHTLAKAAVQVADQFGVGLGQFTKRALKKLDANSPFGSSVAATDFRRKTQIA
jgi:hypothetical protein